MKETDIRQLLEKDLKKISIVDFNDVIIAESRRKVSDRKSVIFAPKDLVVSFVGTFLLYLVLEWFSKSNSTTLLVSLTLCLIPLFFIVFNKIHQFTIR